MKFIIPKSGKVVAVNKKLINLSGGEFETKDKQLQEILKKCKGVSELKQKQKEKLTN